MKNIRIVFLVSFVVLLSGCEKDNNSSSMKGNIVGFVQLFDGEGIEINDKSGVKVSLENSPYSTTTNEIGRYELKNVSAGTYNLIYSKENFGIAKRFSYQFVGGNVPAISYYNYLFQEPSYTISNIQINPSPNYIEVSGEITETESYTLLFYTNDSANVSNTNYDKLQTSSACCEPHTSFYSYLYPMEWAFAPGQKVYLAIYGVNKMDYGYFDPNTSEFYYQSIKKLSGVFEIVIE